MAPSAGRLDKELLVNLDHAIEDRVGCFDIRACPDLTKEATKFPESLLFFVGPFGVLCNDAADESNRLF